MRGAAHEPHRLLLAHPTVPRDRITIVTHSSRNRAQALVLASRDLGIRYRAVLPRTTSGVKKAAVRGYGATVTECEPTLEARECDEVQKEVEVDGEEKVARLIPPCDHYAWDLV
jgi:threonine dehydratase/serine racemase